LLLPTTIAVNSAGNSILKLATIPIGLFFLVTLILSDRKLQINGVHLALLLYTLAVVATLFCDAGSTAVSYVIGYILNAALYVCLTVFPYNQTELELMEMTQILLLIILNAMTLFSGGTEDNRTTLVIMGQSSDPNYFVGFFIFPLAVALKQLVSGKHSLLYLALIAVSVYSVFLSGSRGGFLAVAFMIAGFAFLYPSGFAKRFLFLIGGTVLILMLWTLFKPILPENIVERMSVKSVVETGGTGRIEIWSSMLREIVDQPEKLLLGRGITAMHRMLKNGSLVNVVAHNQVIQTLYNQGLFGLLSFLLLTGISFFRCLKRRKTVSIAILGMMALSVSLSFNQTTRTFWNLIAYAAFAFPDSDINTINHGGLSDHEHA
jgi:O-antigen ligase